MVAGGGDAESDAGGGLAYDDRAGDGPWPALRRLTAARIGLQRSGASLATRPLLDFRLAHARARDAVYAGLGDIPGLDALAMDALGLPVLHAATQAGDRRTYLMRPDLGRCLDPDMTAVFAPHAGRYDLAIAIADGLSAQATACHAVPLLRCLLPMLAGWSLAPLTVLRQARVAAGDEVAAALGADAVLVLIGERPGLSAPDSLGAYPTWAPHAGTTDAERNCVSNIRPDGLPCAEAARRLSFLLHAMRANKLSGVALKDGSDQLPAPSPSGVKP